jgi:hypothetical protein
LIFFTLYFFLKLLKYISVPSSNFKEKPNLINNLGSIQVLKIIEFTFLDFATDLNESNIFFNSLNVRILLELILDILNPLYLPFVYIS